MKITIIALEGDMTSAAFGQADAFAVALLENPKVFTGAIGRFVDP